MKYVYGIRSGANKIKTKTAKYVAAGTTLAALVGLASAPALAVAVSDGSFEAGNPSSPYQVVSSGDSTTIPGWTVTQNTVDYINGYWTSSNGAKSIDLSGNDAGGLRQSLTTVAGHVYTVTFDLAGNPDGAPNLKTLTVDSGGTPMPYTFNAAGHTTASMGWTNQTFGFTANSSSTPLTFTSTTSGAFGPALDNVVISVNPPTTKDQCKNDGWKDYTALNFKNQGKCIDYVQAEVEGKLKLANPSQKIEFEASNTQKGNVEYTNFEHPEGNGVLHYKAKVTCAAVDPQNKSARFMFQIPDGHPGLSGLYVVVGVQKIKNAPDVYGHAATADLTTATQWCQTGVGFSPTNYAITKGHIEFE